LILAWQIKGKNVLVVGGGEVHPNLPNISELPLLRYQANLFARLLLVGS
jgi:siroheme synthase (precorrin-2 oxidase/ferrochelatase)